MAYRFVTSERTGEPGTLKKIAREYLGSSSQCPNPIEKNIYEMKLLLVMTIEQLMQATVLNIGSLPARIPIQVAQIN
jgi:hypothetical protein